MYPSQAKNEIAGDSGSEANESDDTQYNYNEQQGLENVMWWQKNKNILN